MAYKKLLELELHLNIILAYRTGRHKESNFYRYLFDRFAPVWRCNNIILLDKCIAEEAKIKVITTKNGGALCVLKWNVSALKLSVYGNRGEAVSPRGLLWYATGWRVETTIDTK